MPNIRNLSLKGGTDKTFTLYARDDSNTPLSLSSASLTVRVGRPPSCPQSDWPLFTLACSVVSAAAGSFTTSFTASATQYMSGDYAYEAWATISGQVSVPCEGRLRVFRHLTG